MSANGWRITTVSILAVIVVACGVSFCQQKEVSSRPTIGFAAMNVEMTWMKFAYQTVYRKSSELGVELVTYDANNELSKQINSIEYMIRTGVDAILTNPIDVAGLNPVLNKAFEKHIPVATFDRAAPEAPCLFFVGSDDVEAGRIACRFIAGTLNGSATIVMLEGAAGSSPALNRTKGFLEELEKYPGMTVAFRRNADFLKNRGYRVMEEAMACVSRFDAVYAQNDDMMLGALEAMENAGVLPDHVLTVGNDAIPEALKAIETGRMDATIQYPIRQAELAVEQLVAYLTKKQMPARKIFRVKPWLITRGNLTSGDFYPLMHQTTDEAAILSPDDNGLIPSSRKNALER